jgi:hypothetical protein
VPGFFYFVARAGRPRRSEPQIRLYLNLRAAAAEPFISALCSEESIRDVRFEAKVLNDPALFERVDPAVIYCEPAVVGALVAFVEGFAAEASGGLGESVPLFTHRVAPGVGLAESPDPGPDGHVTSFGDHRCRLLAGAVLESLQTELPEHEWLTAAERAFSTEGLTLEAACSKRFRVRGVGRGLVLERRDGLPLSVGRGEERLQVDPIQPFTQ